MSRPSHRSPARGRRLALLLAGLTACGAPRPALAPGTQAGPASPTAPTAAQSSPILPPREAYARGWMPLSPTGVDRFLKSHPHADGRGVLIGILDSGLDPGIAGLGKTSTGARKILDLRDFSGEGAVHLMPVVPAGDRVTIAGRSLTGISRVRARAVGTTIWAGTIAERPLGELPASDLNGNGSDRDTLPLVVVRASDGWVLFADTDGDGSLANESPVHDYLEARETFGWHTGRHPTPLTIAANFAETDGAPRLDLFFDTSGHGSHVAGIAAGHDMYGVSGFDGVAPGAQLLGLKIADNADGGISTTGSMLRALEYALRFAGERRLPLVLNMSFGVGNEAEGRARMDQLIDSVLAGHPDVVFTISAGNDGPGLSTVGFPGSTDRVLTVGATFPSVFLGSSSAAGDPVADFSSRGGELAKPDLVTPGVAYSTVPRWNTGDEEKGGTSMAAPHAAGLAALLVSGLVQSGRIVSARQVRQALMVTARPVGPNSYLDDGTGLPDVGAAWRWLATDRTVPDISVRALGGGVTAAFRIRPPGTSGDTAQAFLVKLAPGTAPVPVTLRSNVGWIHAPRTVTLAPGENTVTLGYVAAVFNQPGVYTGVVTGWTGDTILGPVFRLVNTVVVPDTGATVVADLGAIPAGGDGRVVFHATAGRPFVVGYATRKPGQQMLAYLHEPGGQPYREENGIGAGYGDQAGLYAVDARDVQPGYYEAVAAAPPLDGANALIVVQQSPVRIDAIRGPDSVTVELQNLGAERLATEPFLALVGAERTSRVVANGSARHPIRFVLPPWAVHATIDVSMDRAQWPRFTDFGVTLLSGDGRQLGKSPLNYAFGRLHVNLPDSADRTAGEPAELVLTPGFADPTGDVRWTALVSIRLYTDSAHVTQLPARPLDLAPGTLTRLPIPFPGSPLPLGDAFFPLGIVVVPVGDHTWTREVALPPPITPLSQ